MYGLGSRARSQPARSPGARFRPFSAAFPFSPPFRFINYFDTALQLVSHQPPLEDLVCASLDIVNSVKYPCASHILSSYLRIRTEHRRPKTRQRHLRVRRCSQASRPECREALTVALASAHLDCVLLPSQQRRTPSAAAGTSRRTRPPKGAQRLRH